jgi:hypothetical protein
MTTQSLSFVFAAFLLAVVFSFSSCSEDEGGVSASGKASLRINVAGISAGGEELLTRAALEPETVVLTADDGTAVEFTLSVDPASLTRATHSPMDNDTKYRVIVYKASNNSYVTEAVCTAGFEGSITGLEQETEYKLVAISYNTTTTPPAIDLDGNGFADADYITVDPPIDLLHWVSSNTVTIASESPSPTVSSIIFNHRFPKVTVTVDASQTGNNITAVPASVALTPGKKSQLTLLTDGAPTATTEDLSAQTFTLSTINTQTSTGSSRYVFTGSAASFTLTFSGDLKVDAPSGIKTLSDPVVTFNKSGGLLPGYSYTLTMRVVASKGDYYPIPTNNDTYEVTIPLGTTYSYTPTSGVGTGSTNTLTFLRYNLGADHSLSVKEQMAYPHTDYKNIRVYGGLFQWGRNDISHTLRDNRSTAVTDFFTTTLYGDLNDTPSKFVHGGNILFGTGFNWTNKHIGNSNLWGNGGGVSYQTNFSHNSSTPFSGQTGIAANSKNPCPNGYRVPTQHEWALILNEDGSHTATTNDYFNSAGTNTDGYGTTWYVPSSNPNVVWVRVSDKQAATSFLSNKMNGYALYDATDTAIDDPGKRDLVFVAGKDLTDSSAPNPLMFLPAAGYRDYQNTSNVPVRETGIGGYYWSSVVSSYYSYSMDFTSSLVKVQVNGSRAYGRSVRCIKEL